MEVWWESAQEGGRSEEEESEEEERGKSEGDMEERDWRLKGSTLKRLQELTAQGTSLHHEMQVLQTQRSRHGGEQQSLKNSTMWLERLRRQSE